MKKRQSIDFPADVRKFIDNERKKSGKGTERSFNKQVILMLRECMQRANIPQPEREVK